MTTLGEMVAQVQGHLNQYAVNRPATCTFEDWQLSGSAKIGVKLKDVSNGDQLINALVELHTGELIHVSSYNSISRVATCPPWFRAQLGTPANDSVSLDSRAVIEPLWPLYSVAQKLVEGIHNLYPDLCVIKESPPLTSSLINGNYELPDDVDGIVSVTLEVPGSTQHQFKLWQWSLDTSNPDGNKYLRTNPAIVGGRPIYVTYRAKPVVPAAADTAATWTSTGLPDSAMDLPVLYAVYTLIPAVDLAKTQVHSMEQSDRNRLVQGGAANSASRRYQEMYQSRLVAEKRKLRDRYPPRVHMQLNG